MKSRQYTTKSLLLFQDCGEEAICRSFSMEGMSWLGENFLSASRWGMQKTVKIRKKKDILDKPGRVRMYVRAHMYLNIFGKILNGFCYRYFYIKYLSYYYQLIADCVSQGLNLQ